MDRAQVHRAFELVSEQALEAGEVLACIGGNDPMVWVLEETARQLGLVLAVLNDSWSPQRLSGLLNKLGAQFTVGYGERSSRPDLRPLLDLHIDRAGNWTRISSGRCRPKTSHGLPSDCAGAVVFSTSGSSGEPKCVVSTPENRRFCTSTIGAYLGLEPGQTIVSALPPSFSYGFFQGPLAEAFATEISLVASPQLVGEILNRAAQPRTVLPLTPTIGAQVCAAARGQQITSVEIITLAGGAASVGLRQALTQTFPRARIFAMYGLTECARIAYLDPDQFLLRPSSCGREMPGVSGRLVDARGQVVALGEVGELVVAGPNVCAGYWGDVVASRNVFQNDQRFGKVLHTGDRFRRDAEGYLEFVGRMDALVKVRDERVSLALAETELKQSDLVLDLVLELQTSPEDRPVLGARVVGRSGATEREVAASFRRLASRPAHVPERIVMVDTLAIGPHGKPQINVKK